MRVVIKKSADQADGHNVPIASRYSFQISASLPQKKPKGILRRRKPSNILVSNRYPGSLADGRAVPIPVSANSSLPWGNEKFIQPTDFVDTEQWIEAVDSSGTTYYRQDEKSFFPETPVEELSQQEAVDESVTTYICSTCNYDSTDFNDFSAHDCIIDESLVTPSGVEPSTGALVKDTGTDDKRVRKIEPIERAIAEILMNIESSCYDNAAQQGAEASENQVVYDESGEGQQEDGDDGDVVMEYVENPQQGDDGQQSYELEEYTSETAQEFEEGGADSAPVQLYVTDVPEVSENTTVVASLDRREYRKKSDHHYPSESQNCIISLHPQFYGDVKHEFTCELCQSQYAHMNGYALHMYKIHHVKVNYEFMCEYCKVMFSGYRFLIDHVTDGACAGVKASVRYQPCDRCPMKFRTVDILRSHMVSVHNVDCLWHCDECSVEFSSQLNFESHDCGSILSRRRRQEFRCRICLKTLASKVGLNQHYRNIHNKESWNPRRRLGPAMLSKRPDRPFGKENLNKSGVSYYVLPEPIPAAQYNKKYTRYPPHLARPKTTAPHTAPSDTVLEKQCEKCDLQFDADDELERHLENDHGSESGDFECAFCGDEFVSRAEMRIHIDFEHGFKTYTPSEERSKAAEARPATQTMLPNDLLMSLKKILYKNPKKKTCDICSVVVRANVDLLDHVIQHRIDDIEAMIERVTRTSISTCKFCNKTFEGKVIPHACRKVKCPYCKGWFAGQQFLTKHIKTLHAAGPDGVPANQDTRYGSTYGIQQRPSRPVVSKLPPVVPSPIEYPAPKEDTVDHDLLPSVQVHEMPQEILEDETVEASDKPEVKEQEDVEFKMAALFSELSQDELQENAPQDGSEEAEVPPESGEIDDKGILPAGGIEEGEILSEMGNSEIPLESDGIENQDVDENMGEGETLPQSGEMADSSILPDESAVILPSVDEKPFELKDVISNCGINEELENPEMVQKIVYVNEAGEIIPESEIQFITDPENQDENQAELYENQAEYSIPGDETQGIRYILADGEEYNPESIQYIEGLDTVEPGTAVYLVDSGESMNYQCQYCGLGFEVEDMWMRHEEMHQLIDGNLAMEEDPATGLV